MKRITVLFKVILMVAVTAMAAGCEKEEDTVWVDLGLPSGILWASCNVGATSPEEFGNLYAWAETEPKELYNWGNYFYCKGHYNDLTKYCTNKYLGFDQYCDTLTTLESCDDAATMHYGGRTPNFYEWKELIENTTSKWTKRNKVWGRRFTGPNGKSIFIPATFNDNTFGLYWGNAIVLKDYPCQIGELRFSKDILEVFTNERKFGLAVRAVKGREEE